MLGECFAARGSAIGAGPGRTLFHETGVSIHETAVSIQHAGERVAGVLSARHGIRDIEGRAGMQTEGVPAHFPRVRP